MVCEILSNGQKAEIVAVACGSGHVLAASSSGELYSWGLNCKGQLGLSDIRTRHSPQYVFKGAKKVFASTYSSACIDQNGFLYTWGSDIGGNLMQVS